MVKFIKVLVRTPYILYMYMFTYIVNGCVFGWLVDIWWNSIKCIFIYLTIFIIPTYLSKKLYLIMFLLL